MRYCPKTFEALVNTLQRHHIGEAHPKEQFSAISWENLLQFLASLLAVTEITKSELAQDSQWSSIAHDVCLQLESHSDRVAGCLLQGV